MISVIQTGLFYGVTLVPILVYNSRNPGVLTKRLNEISYIKPGVPLGEVLSQFVRRYLEDQSLEPLLTIGDVYPRHHVAGSGGAFFFATFILALIGLVIILTRHKREPWWHFVLYGLAISIVPGAISLWPFHSMRLMAYPVFLTVLTVPALEWLLSRGRRESDLAASPSRESGESSLGDGKAFASGISAGGLPLSARLLILFSLLVLTGVEAYRFQIVFRRDGPNRVFHFDIDYKVAYDMATKQPVRPIYLEDGKWGPAYIHALWYATVERRPTSQFVHLAPGARAPAGKIVIRSGEACDHCETLSRTGVYHVYKSL